MTAIPHSELFTRHPANPIITSAHLPYAANSVFNPGATMLDGETILLMRVEDRRGLSHLTVARSHDGVAGWRIDSDPTFAAEPDTYPEELWGIEDPRLTYIEEEQRWIVAYTAYSSGGPLVSLATTENFETFERLGPVMPPEDKDAALFPVKFDGRWALIHRPIPSFGIFGAHMWISFSPDLKHWGDHRILLKARQGAWWDAQKIGLSPQPLKTDPGWLILYHGVRVTASGSIYRLGLALLDLENPRRVLRRSSEWVFSPSETYERFGEVADVVFPCGWTLVDDEVRLYYGAADTTIGLATGRLPELLDWLDKHDSQAEE
ncbi:MAG: glycosidase [Gemmatimonadales bacterium]|nr:glycosidase [Gemmatimonadales bacterium]